MQSTALALMSCENANAAQKGRAHPYPLVPVYDLVVFCDLGFEPPWVMRQAEFVHQACQDAGLRYEMLYTPLYDDLMQNFGKRRVVSGANCKVSPLGGTRLSKGPKAPR